MLKAAAVFAALIAVLGVVGTPDYVLDVERENERLRAEIQRTTLELKQVRLVSAECRDADVIAAHQILARGE